MSWFTVKSVLFPLQVIFLKCLPNTCTSPSLNLFRAKSSYKIHLLSIQEQYYAQEISLQCPKGYGTKIYVYEYERKLFRNTKQ